MKTAISLPDGTSDRVSRRASELGISRSEFFADAAKRYLDDLEKHSLTEQINKSLRQAAARDESSEFAVNAGRNALLAYADEW